MTPSIASHTRGAELCTGGKVEIAEADRKDDFWADVRHAFGCAVVAAPLTALLFALLAGAIALLQGEAVDTAEFVATGYLAGFFGRGLGVLLVPCRGTSPRPPRGAAKTP